MNAKWPGLLLFGLVACAPSDPCDVLQDLAATPGGLELTEEEHPGWGRDVCLQCHPVSTFHEVDCFSAADVDFDAIDEQVDPLEPETCIACHGTNGVEGWVVDTGEAR